MNKHILLPFIVWIGLRFGPKGASFSAFLVIIQCAYWLNRYSITETLSQDLTLAENAYLFQTYMAVVVFLGMVPAAMMAERRLSEKVLRENENRYQSLFDNNLNGVILVNPEKGQILAANPAAAALFGRSVGEMLHLSVDELLGDALQQATYEVNRKETPQQQRWFLDLVHRDGTSFHADLSSQIFLDRDGKERSCVVIRDITELKQAEESLRQSEQRFKAFFDLPLVGMTITKPDMQWVLINDKFCEMLGYSRDELLALTWLDLTPEEDREAEKQRYHAFLLHSQSGHSTRLQKRYCRKDGMVIDVEVSSMPVINEDGNADYLVSVITDITEMKRNEESLRQSKEFALSVFDSLSANIAVLDEDGTILAVNKAWKKFSEQNPPVPLNVGIGSNYLEICENADGDCREEALQFAQGIREVIHNNRSEFSMEYPCHSPTERRWFIGRVTRFPSQGPIRVVVAHENITARKLAEEALHSRILSLTQPLEGNSQIEFKDIFDLNEIQKIQDAFAAATGVASIITDPSGKPITRPSNFCYLCENIIRKTEKGLANCMHSDAVLGRKNPDGPIVQPCLSGGLWDGGASICVENHHIANWLIGQVLDENIDPEKIFQYTDEIGADREQVQQALININRMPAEQFKKVCEALFIIAQQLSKLAYQNVQQARFISERKKAEEEIRRSRSHVRAILDNLPYKAWLKDREGRFIAVNKGIADGCKIPIDEIIGKTDVDIWPEEFGRKYMEDDRRVIETGQSLEIREQIFENGQIRWYETFKMPVRDENGHIIGTSGLARDITDKLRLEEEHKKLQAQLLQTQKMESLGILAGGIAHDFNNLLTAIMGNASMALMDLSPVSPARDSIRDIEKAATRAADLAKQMLAYSGKGRFVVQTLNLNDVVLEMAHLLEASISKKVAIIYEFEPDLPNIEADVTQIRQVIMNLITNASEALGDNNGTITLFTYSDWLDQTYLSETYMDENLTEGRYVCLEVRDTGCGMDKETMAKIFDPFFTTKFTGRGLGLAALLGIVRGHRGAIKVYSELGKGSSFKILFPTVEKPVDTTMTQFPVSLSSWKGQGTILLVDDEETVIDVGSKMLSRLGFQVLVACDGLQALEIFSAQRNSISVIILDLTMPRMDGEQTFRELRKIKADVKVILSSGYNQQDVTQKFVGRGLAGFIQKPYRLDNLKEVLQKVTTSDHS